MFIFLLQQNMQSAEWYKVSILIEHKGTFFLLNEKPDFKLKLNISDLQLIFLHDSLSLQINTFNTYSMEIPIYQIDAFTNELFKGNPAAVCVLTEWINDDLMQQIAGENNLAETAFIVKKEDDFQIRWFTPTVEVNLCGHATLASAFALFNFMNYTGETIHFVSPRSGKLSVSKKNDLLLLNFPTDSFHIETNTNQIEECIGVQPVELYKGKTDYMAVVESEEQIRTLAPDFRKIAELNARGLIVTAPGNSVDFVSRFFAPQSGIDEDPVTGSAHTTLTPFWSEKLKKTEMSALQLSKRGGALICVNSNERCLIGGKARLFFKGIICL
jgi:phenazine biosynthesis protein PhzF family